MRHFWLDALVSQMKLDQMFARLSAAASSSRSTAPASTWDPAARSFSPASLTTG